MAKCLIIRFVEARCLMGVMACLMLMAIVVGGCRKNQPQPALLPLGERSYDPYYTHADSLILKALVSGEYERMMVLTDSLASAGQLNDLRANGYRVIAYENMGDIRKAIDCLSLVVTEEHPSEQDLLQSVFFKTLYAELQQMQGNSEEALRTALLLVKRLQEDGKEDDDINQRLYTVIGNCLFAMERPGEAADNYERVYGFIKRSIKNDTTGAHLINSITQLFAIATTYLNSQQFDGADLWVNRLDSIITLTQGTPMSTPQSNFIEMNLCMVKLYRAQIAEGCGKKVEGLQFFRDYLATDFAKTPLGRIHSCDYLMATHQYNEAANSYAVLDQFTLEYGMEPTLEKIGEGLMRKFRANYYAGRKDSALRVAAQIAEAYDSAFIRQKRDATAELAIVYDVEGKERMIAEREAKIMQQRFLGVTIASVGLVIFFVVFTWLRHRAAKRLAQVQAEKARIEGELGIARTIQMSMVPSRFPKREGLDMYAVMEPAKEVGGDLYGYLLKGSKLYFCVGDVSGKGVPASLFMTQVVRLFRTLAAQGLMPEEICTRMNDELSGEDNVKCMFVTFFLGLLDLTTGHLDFCNAGHSSPFLSDGEKGGDFIQMVPNTAIGLMPMFKFKGEEIDCIKGKRFFVYTDGVNEAMDKQNKQYGKDRLQDFLRKADSANAQTLIDTLTAEVEKHRNGAEASDDLTMMAIRL